MTFVEVLIKNSSDIWEQYLEHPFTNGVVDGTMDAEKFKNYIIEDSIYLNAYARAFAGGMYNSTRREDLQFFYKSLNFIEEGEGSTRVYYLKKYNLTDEWIDQQEPKPENKEYIDFMLGVAKDGTALETWMAILPCIFSYAYIFRELTKSAQVDESNPYKRFLDDYISENYHNYCVECGKYVNKLTSQINMTPEYKDKLSNIFRKSSLCELEFWNMANRK
ncbi:hypothetical protein AN639_00480 [Candidatus Epulonipiscium fishelsonii]|uniref:Uncharacterized protein n=1 Tax=Candidatus Epulonipiscium fishelsonii TaxID=77094 RepID=A0ACC8XBS2_9FIRM|nr:hypothetical protein AN396_07140 [Epulopiscium sp. SCG-B11WGA-EpuloA1]ONI41277.1 hypothetical protein AN639_00480 [Epulopiscium sp. SCG-B05WGA-EpuloA1]